MRNYFRNPWLVALLALATGLFLGYLFWSGNDANEQEADHSVAEHADETVWTCSMHPQIRQSEPGKCPICGMDLIPLASDDGGVNAMAVSMTETAVKLANVQTMQVGTAAVEKAIRLNGTVVPDEKLVKSQSAHVSGRVEQLFVNTTGEYVQKGQRLASIYSPELIAAQQELLQTLSIKDSQPALYKASVEKLKALRLSEKQINGIGESGNIRETIDILADQSGIVMEKKVNVGNYLKRGEALYTIADLSRVWVEFDAYENDLPWVDLGDRVEFTVASLPGQKFDGKVTFISPVINMQTRVARVRVETANPGQKLKPQMFATGIVQAEIRADDQQLTLPKSAVMWTGERSVVYVKDQASETPSFLMREVVLGPSLGDRYVVEEGLETGELVVVNGTFTVDAAAQLAGKPSMMNPEGGAAMTGHDHGVVSGTITNAPVQRVKASEAAKKELEDLILSYYPLKDALVASNHKEAVIEAKDFKARLNKISMKNFEGEAHDLWMQLQGTLNRNVEALISSANIDQARKHFIPLSEGMVKLAKSFGPFAQAIYVQHCPMANDDKGADWLSSIDEIRNPYYGEMMLTCGEVSETIE
ncbi:Putative Co/Zn/Cd efflux system membrane fusion protein [Fulvivirga imtechensis AK7]|uniref:Putative Co/Zn/Cd efflux system membrane fusion protein n=1 Tax=Fulvivirga imtechensis AK7 TaxID=1237149 RepID=L8K0W9_9BACT|nr:efflux RND transporter periplasmic adaptor subunit [Fulvivirga imtechensis]ELR73107.1 Putative Co/Zn/Cd efflux system membrane fusion protein [Fulvivirga imtechensis AK7]